MISRQSESSVCFSELFSVFNLNCFSDFHWHTPLLSFPLAQVGFHKMWAIFMREVFTVTWVLLHPFESFHVFKMIYRDKLATSGLTHFQQPLWGESVRDMLRLRKRKNNESVKRTFLNCYTKSLLLFCEVCSYRCSKSLSPNSPCCWNLL